MADNATVCEPPTALSVMVKVPVFAPPVLGSKNTPIEQLEPAATLLPHVLTTPKSAELTTTLAILSAADPEFVTVTVLGRLDAPAN
jgi:hypothetical protein